MRVLEFHLFRQMRMGHCALNWYFRDSTYIHFMYTENTYFINLPCKFDVKVDFSLAIFLFNESQSWVIAP